MYDPAASCDIADKKDDTNRVEADSSGLSPRAKTNGGVKRIDAHTGEENLPIAFAQGSWKNDASNPIENIHASDQSVAVGLLMKSTSRRPRCKPDSRAGVVAGLRRLASLVLRYAVLTTNQEQALAMPCYLFGEGEALPFGDANGLLLDRGTADSFSGANWKTSAGMASSTVMLWCSSSNS